VHLISALLLFLVFVSERGMTSERKGRWFAPTPRFQRTLGWEVIPNWESLLNKSHKHEREIGSPIPLKQQAKPHPVRMFLALTDPLKGGLADEPTLCH
jgi:hypothetical protein